MTETTGFWKLAAEDPDRLAVVDPDGREITSGELLAEANRLVHGLRALGLRRATGSRRVLPERRRRCSTLYLAATQAGWYLTPINHHLVGPEIAYIVDDCEAKAFVAHERFADGRAGAPPRRSAARRRRVRGRRRPGLPPLRRPHRRPARHRARGPRGRRGDELHVGHDRPPKGVRRRALGRPTPTPSPRRGAFLRLFGIQPHDGNVHLVRLAALPHRRARPSRLRRCTSATRSC